MLCLSVNDAVVHGIPGRTRLCDGDLLSIDCGASIDGYRGDAAALTLGIGQIDDGSRRLADTTAAALAAGIAQALAGQRIGDTPHAIETVARGGYGLPSGLGGHGITLDGRRAAHFEHSVAITGDGPVILTAL